MNDRYKSFGTGAALIVAAAVSGFISSRSNRPAPTAFHTQAFYTTDDGATLFADSAELLPPFDHAGQQAVRAHVYTGDQGAHRWVQYLEKYSDDSRLQLSGHSSAAPIVVLVKKPGSSQWIPRTTTEALDVVVPKPPDGNDAKSIEPVFP